MAITFIRLFSPTQLTISAAIIYSCPTSPTTSVVKNLRVRLTNTTGGAVQVTLYMVPAGDSPSAANECLSSYSISANGYLDVDIPTLSAGDTFQGLAGSGAAITVHEIGGTIFS